MSISRKLLIILLTVALPPLVFISYFDRRATESLGHEMIVDRQALLAESVLAQLTLAVEASVRLLASKPDGDQWDESVFDLLVLPGDWAGEVVVTLTPPTPEAFPLRRGPSGGMDLAMEEEMLKASLALTPAGGELTMAVPLRAVRAKAAVAQEKAEKYIGRQMAVGGTGVAVFGLVVVLLSMIGSRAITGPVKTLTLVARRIAEGDLGARAHVHTGDELEELSDSFNAMIPKLQDRIKIRGALALAMEVQQNLLPVSAPHLRGFDIAGKSLYCDETGGDYYDFLELSRLDGQCVGVAVGDVTGHGVAAALLMTTARALLRSRAHQPGSLSELMTDINRHLSEDTHQGRFMTLFYGVIDAESGSFRWISAGHEPAQLYDPASDSFEEISGPDIPLGIEPDWIYEEGSRGGFRPGQVIAIGTDGIWETRNAAGVMLGREAVRGIIRDNAHRSAEELCEAISDALLAFRGARPQEDDATLVVVKVTSDYSA